MNSEQIWLAAQEELKGQLSKPSYETWLKNTSLISLEDRDFCIGVPSKLAKDWLEERYLAVIRETLTDIMQGTVNVRFIITQPSAGDLAGPAAEDEHDAPPSEAGLPEEHRSEAPLLNPRYQFANFVVGNNSRFAHAASKAVADAPGRAYNPLFLYGGVGLGKTHLMHAIGHAVMEKHRNRRVTYITSEKFTNEVIASIQANTMNSFRNKYRSIDVLLVDDIQFLAGKERTQEEFFHTFNALHEINRQIVISSDRPPKEIPTLEDRLRSRFEWGLLADLQPPDLETRIAILRSKLDPHAVAVPDDVLSFIAHSIQRNIRELEGALTRVVAFAELTRSTVTVEHATEVLQDMLPDSRTRPLSIDHIQRVVAEFYGTTLEEMKGRRRDRAVVFPRQVAMYLVREETASSLPTIGQAFGGRDHTTVIHSYEKISTELREDPRLEKEIAAVRERLFR